MDPVLLNMSRFTTQEDLHQKIERLFVTLDKDSSGTLGFEELSSGLKELQFSTPVNVQEDDYDILTQGRSLCDEHGEFDQHQFRAMMESEMKRYALRELSTAMNEGDKQIAQILKPLQKRFQTKQNRTELIGHTSQPRNLR